MNRKPLSQWSFVSEGLEHGCGWTNLKVKLNNDNTELMIIGSRQQLEKVSVAELSVGGTSVASGSTTRLLV